MARAHMDLTDLDCYSSSLSYLWFAFRQLRAAHHHNIDHSSGIAELRLGRTSMTSLIKSANLLGVWGVVDLSKSIEMVDKKTSVSSNLNIWFTFLGAFSRSSCLVQRAVFFLSRFF